MSAIFKCTIFCARYFDWVPLPRSLAIPDLLFCCHHHTGSLHIPSNGSLWLPGHEVIDHSCPSLTLYHQFLVSSSVVSLSCRVAQIYFVCAVHPALRTVHATTAPWLYPLLFIVCCLTLCISFLPPLYSDVSTFFFRPFHPASPM